MPSDIDVISTPYGRKRHIPQFHFSGEACRTFCGISTSTASARGLKIDPENVPDHVCGVCVDQYLAVEEED